MSGWTIVGATLLTLAISIGIVGVLATILWQAGLIVP